MKNTIFTIYFSPKDDDKYIDLLDYNAFLECLLGIILQNKINKEKKAKKIMLDFFPDLEEDKIEDFRKYFYNGKPWQGIVNLSVSTKNVNWNNLLEKEKKIFLIEKWKILFNNLSDDYFVVDKSEVIKSLEELKSSEWKLTIPLFNRKLKYNKLVYDIVLNISPAKAELLLVRKSDEKHFNLKNYQTRKIIFDINFKNFKIINEDTLMLENKLIFLPPEIFDLREIILN